MSLPAVDPDPDPTTQIPWPGARKRSDRDPDDSQASSTPAKPSNNSSRRPSVGSTDDVNRKRRRLSTLDLHNLSISMAGAQIAWTVELGYGTPFLLSLGVSEQVTSLVWLAGPISGLICQPVIGAISDSSTSKYRRRYWIVWSTFALVASTLTLAYCEDIASVFVDTGDWGPKRHQPASSAAIALAIVSFYVLDFALNALQASLRNLLLDITPPEQLSAGNAWHSRMTQAGNIVGYGFGFLPLSSLPIIRLLGGDQFRKFCIIVIVLLVITVWITCYTQTEEEPAQQRPSEGTFREIWNNIYIAVIALPEPVRRVCYVQIFAFMGWFPFLFYSTTYVGQIMAQQYDKEPDNELATRTGALALLIHSIVAIVAGIVLPHLARRDVRLLAPSDEDEDAELARLRDTVRRWQVEAAHKGKPLRLPIMPFLLRNVWMGAMLLFSLITASTFFITQVWQAIVAISLIGICWAVQCWVPFAVIMEYLKELDSPAPERSADARTVNHRASHTRAVSSPNILRTALLSERQPLLTRRRSFEDQANNEDAQNHTRVAGGTILGIHNLAIVFPQFLTAIASSVIFKLVDAEAHNDPTNTGSFYGKHGVGWVLRFGGLCTLLGAVLCRMVPPTRTEREMKRRLGEMRVLEREPTA